MNLDNVLDRILLDLLSDRIIERMRARMETKTRSALLLFAGTDLGLGAVLGQLQQLGDSGWCFEAVVAPEAQPFLDNRPVGLSLREAGCLTGEILTRHSVILVPALSITLAAKVALGIADDPLSTILQIALESGVRIIAARDGVCPNSRDRRTRGLLPASAYQATMSGYLEKLTDYGIELSWAAKLAAAVNGTRPTPSAPSIVPRIAAIRTEGVFGLREARSLQHGELHLGHAVLVTPAAAEELRARDIKLVRE